MKKFSLFGLLLLALFAVSALAAQQPVVSGTTATATSNNAAEVTALKTQVEKLSKELQNTKQSLASMEEQIMSRVNKELNARDYLKAACDQSKVMWEQTKTQVAYWAKHGHAEVAKHWPQVREQVVTQSKKHFELAKQHVLKLSQLIKVEAIKLGLQDFHAEIATGVVLGFAALLATLVLLKVIQLSLRVVFYFLCCRFCRSSRPRKSVAVVKTQAPPTAQAPAAGNRGSPNKVKNERK